MLQSPTRSADNQCAGQVYEDIYLANPSAGATTYASTKTSIDLVKASPKPGIAQNTSGVLTTPPWVDVEIIQITNDEAINTARELPLKEGIFVGMSSGAALFAARQVASEIESGTIVTIFPDRGEKYLSTELFRV